MDADLEAFEAARSDRAKRTDYEGHGQIEVDEKGGARVSADSTHRDRTRHEGTAAELARAFYAKNSARLDVFYGSLGIERLVQLIESARDRGDEETRAEIDAYLMAKFPPLHIGGAVAKELTLEDVRRLS